MITKPQKNRHTILQEVADKHGVTVEQLKSDARQRRISWPRQEAYARLYRETVMSLTRIGAFLGSRDHTTVLHGIRVYDARQGGNT